MRWTALVNGSKCGPPSHLPSSLYPFPFPASSCPLLFSFTSLSSLFPSLTPPSLPYGPLLPSLFILFTPRPILPLYLPSFHPYKLSSLSALPILLICCFSILSYISQLHSCLMFLSLLSSYLPLFSLSPSLPSSSLPPVIPGPPREVLWLQVTQILSCYFSKLARHSKKFCCTVNIFT